MPRDEYDDRDRDDPDDRDDRPPPKSNTGLILLILGLVIGLPLLGCMGFGVWGFFQAKKGFDQVMTMAGGGMAAESFLRTLEGGNPQLAYDMTSPNFRASTTKPQFEQLVKANPVLTSANTTSQTGFPSPTGTAPNRKMVLSFTVKPGSDPDAFDPDDEDDPEFKPKVPKPTNAKVNPNAKGIICTITVAEQTDGTWKVDGFTIP